MKLYVFGVAVEEPERRRALADEQERMMNWRKSEPFHVFVLDVRRAAYIAFGKKRRMVRWSEDGGLVT